MSWIYTGNCRSLTVIISKYLGGDLVFGYPIIYYGQNNDSGFIDDYPAYSILTDEELGQLSEIDYLARLSDFQTWIEIQESGLSFATDTIVPAELENCDGCPTTTSTTTIFVPTTTTTTTGIPTTTTTTTSCEMPANYTEEGFLYTNGMVNNIPNVDFTGSSEDACEAWINFTCNSEDLSGGFDVNGKWWGSHDNFREGDNIYYRNSCELVATGYYILSSVDHNFEVIYVDEFGVISYTDCGDCPTTTTTTTVAPTTTTTTTISPNLFIFNVTSDGINPTVLPLKSTGGYTYNCDINWNNEYSEHINAGSASYTFGSAGTKRIEINGTCEAFATDNVYFPITEVIQWGTAANFLKLNFYGCTILTNFPIGAITGASNITTFENFVRGCTAYTSIDEDLFTLTPDVTTFKYAFGSSGATGTLGENLFVNNVSATSFEYTFYDTDFNCDIPSALFTENINALNFGYTFGNTAFTGTIPEDLFATCVDAKFFNGTFANTRISAIPQYLFWNNVDAEQFTYTFYNCLYVTDNSPLGYQALNDNLFYNNQLAKYFTACFTGMRNMSSTLPEDMFQRNVLAISFGNTFESCDGLYGDIPAGLFANNPDVTTFANVFALNGSTYTDLLTDIPADLFKYNTKAVTFRRCFRWRYNLPILPNGLFRNVGTHISAGSEFNFEEACTGCMALTVGQYPFSDSTVSAAYNRFTGKTLKVANMFSLGYNVGGTDWRYAPELWDSSIYNSSGVTTYTNCYYILDAYWSKIYSNYCNIPSSWGATHIHAPCSTTTTSTTPIP